MTRDEIAMIADAAAEMAQLSLIQPMQVKIYMETLMHALKRRDIILPQLLAEALDQDDLLGGCGEDIARVGEILRRTAFAKALIAHEGLLIDAPTKAYFDVFAHVWFSLQPYRTDNSPEPGPAAAPTPPPQPGEPGYRRKLTDIRDPRAQGFR